MKTLSNNIGGGKTRQSNMEALRIVAMSMILIHHFMVHGLGAANIPCNLYYIINPFVYCGVNIFFLITGHFSIRYSFRGLTKFVLGILYFGIINILLTYLAGSPVTPKSIVGTILFPVSMSPYWFIQVYLLLMASAPLLNAGLNALTRVQFRNTLIVLTFLVLYMRGGHASHTYFQAVYFYCLGFYFRTSDTSRIFSPNALLIIFLTSCAINGLLDFISLQIRHQAIGYFTLYNNIFVIVGAISLYLLFSKFNFTSPIINRIATASLGCYLLQDGRFGFSFVYDFQSSFLETHGYGWELVGMLIACFLLYWISSYILTSFENLWINNLTDRILDVTHNFFKKIPIRLRP